MLGVTFTDAPTALRAGSKKSSKKNKKVRKELALAWSNQALCNNRTLRQLERICVMCFAGKKGQERQEREEG
jgi:hypothetical protein